jgi:hypothetical protein
MLDAPILDVAIGLFAVYFVLASICSGVKEFIAGLIASRSTTLEAGVRNLLGDDSVTAAFYEHGLIKGLWPKPDRKPSYIPSRTFAVALLDVLAPAAASNSPRTLDEVRNAVLQIQNSMVRGALLPLIDGAKGDLDRVRENVARWFDDAMDRVSGLYKRWAQMIIIVAAIIVVIVLNADLFVLTKALWHEPAIRTAAIEFAQKKIAEGQPQSQPQPNESLPKIAGEIQQLQMPLGWCIETSTAAPHCTAPNSFDPDSRSDWIYKILGLFLSAVLVSLGAPFWFDLLSRVVTLRLAGDQPPRAANNKAIS